MDSESKLLTVCVDCFPLFSLFSLYHSLFFSPCCYINGIYGLSFIRTIFLSLLLHKWRSRAVIHTYMDSFCSKGRFGGCATQVSDHATSTTIRQSAAHYSEPLSPLVAWLMLADVRV